MKKKTSKIIATLGLSAALVLGASVPAQAGTAGTFGNAGPGLSMTIFKQATQTISTIPPGNSTTGVSAVWVKPGRCVYLWNSTGTNLKRCPVLDSYWWSPFDGTRWMGKEVYN